ncbi:MAG: hypothetical protein ACPGQL_04280 [Thermoplasmatota archaeon]
MVYGVFGLRVASDLSLPLRPAEAGTGPADVTIEAAELPAWTQWDQEGPCWQARDGTLRFWLPDEFVMEVAAGGTHIRYHLEDGVSVDHLRPFILGSGLGVVLMQRGVLPLHAAAVVKDGRALLLAGISGAGKSTTTWRLTQEGFASMADDVVALDVGSDGVTARPGMPFARLWDDAVERLQARDAASQRVRPDMEKFLAPYEEAQRHDEEVPVAGIVILAPHGHGEVALEQAQGLASFRQLRAHCYRRRLGEGLGLAPMQFQQIQALLTQVPVHVLRRPRDGDSLDDVVAALGAHFDALAKRAAP